MTDVEAGLESGEPQELVLDPFSFHAGVKSRIIGLGGDAPGHDPAYAFHTPYVEAEPGHAHFSMRFTNLTAKRGTLQLWVNMLPNEPGAHARVANSERMQLNRVVQHGHASIRFEAFRGVKFALHGQIVDDSDAAADGMIVVLDRPAREDSKGPAVEARSSEYGRNAVRGVAQLISTAKPSLQVPMSQVATGSQFQERSYDEWRNQLKLTGSNILDTWSEVYVMQVLSSYGMLQEGATALCFNPRGSAVPDALAARGIAVTIADLEGAGHPETGASYRVISPDSIPEDLVNFDFLWGSDVASRLGSVSAGIGFAERAMGCLRPGGLAIHTLPFDLGHDEAPIGSGGVAFQRNDAARLSLTLVSRNYEVGQIKIDTTRAPIEPNRTDGREISRIGLIARRPVSAY